MSAAPLTPVLAPEVDALEPFVQAGVLDAAAVQVAATIARCADEPVAPEVLLAAALAVRGVLDGHVCIELAEAENLVRADADASGDADGTDADGEPDTTTTGLPWPEVEAWAAALRASGVVADPPGGPHKATASFGAGNTPPLVFDGGRVYLERYWRFEAAVGTTLRERAASVATLGGADGDAVEAALDEAFGPEASGTVDLQRRGARVTLTRRLAVLAGGPGTGKTYALARFLAAAHRLAPPDPPLRVALVAPTGKAASRMKEAVGDTAAGGGLAADLVAKLAATEYATIHRLLGSRGGVSVRHDRDNPLPHDVVVVDETSMVDLPLMARLLDAIRDDARVVLVGDPYQLTSIGAGAVLGDVVGPLARRSSTGEAAGSAPAGPLAGSIVVLERAHRFEEGSAIARLADAIRLGDAEGALAVLADPAAAEVARIDPDDVAAMAALRTIVVDHATGVASAALDGDARLALDRATQLKVLAATRRGRLGREGWRTEIEHGVDRARPGLATGRRWYVGRPVIVTRNDYVTGVYNGDTGIVVQGSDGPVVVLAEREAPLAPSQLDEIETWWSMTIHKSQGSEFDHAVLSLPTVDSPILTRELLYTGVTRGKDRVTLVATEDAIRRAIERPVARASGLQARLW